MNHANHAIVLVYIHDRGELEVGTVQCVPRKGELVVLLVDGHAQAYLVEQLMWIPNDETCAPADLKHGTRFTVVRCSLSRCA